MDDLPGSRGYRAHQKKSTPLPIQLVRDYLNTMLEIKSQHQAHTGSLTARSEGEVVGHIDFVSVDPETIDLTHTEVFPRFEGRGFGRDLVKAAVDFARAEGLKLEASCPFARKVLVRNPEYRDALR
jgi:predicted GNAT family acetyltransferase